VTGEVTLRFKRNGPTPPPGALPPASTPASLAAEKLGQEKWQALRVRHLPVTFLSSWVSGAGEVAGAVGETKGLVGEEAGVRQEMWARAEGEEPFCHFV
jgi:hypothetical protein